MRRLFASRTAATPLASGFISFLCVVAALAASAPARADPTSISSEPTNLSGNAERIISYRHQERMWQTPDGALHVVINRGGFTNSTLVLNSSYDGGVTWVVQATFANTNKYSTADGLLQGSLLALVYATKDGRISFAQLSYDSTLRIWQVNRSETAFNSSEIAADVPTVAIDDLGVVWCGFWAVDRTTGGTNLRLVYRPGDGVWLDTGLIVGPTDASKERSVRMTRLPGAMGVIYRIGQATYWTTRDNYAPYGDLSTPVKIHEGPPQKKISDPYASHFSVIADDAGYLHLLVADAGEVTYQRYSIHHGVWTPARKIIAPTKVNFLQIGIANGQVAAVYSGTRGAAGAVWLSQDSGDTFIQQFVLSLPDATDGVSYNIARVEMAGRSVGALAVLQLYEDRRVHRLMLYKVPVP